MSSAYALEPEQEEKLTHELRDLLIREFVMKNKLSIMELKVLLDKIPDLQDYTLYHALSQPCEKAFNGECLYASPNCFKSPPYDPKYWRTIPGRRWIDCYGWKKTNGLVFSKKLASYILPRCPLCDGNLLTIKLPLYNMEASE
jgi:hypothetical protein